MSKTVQKTEQKNEKDLTRRQLTSISITDFANMVAGGDGIHDPFVMRNLGAKVRNNWIPRLSLEPRNVKFAADGTLEGIKKFTLAEKAKFGAVTTNKAGASAFIWPKYWLNPYQYQDYIILQDTYANTISGRIIDIIVYFSLANGIQPKLAPRDRGKYESDEKMQAAMKKAEWLLDLVKEVEKNISTSGEPKPFEPWDSQAPKYIPYYTEEGKDDSTYDSPLQAKWASAMTLALAFGRTAVVPNIDANNNAVTVNIGGAEYKFTNIPKIMQLIHPRDLGYNHVAARTWKLLGIQLYNSNWILKPDQMIFFEWNSNNPVYGSLYYGYSLQQSMLGSARSLRRIIEVDFPLIAKTRWSGMYWVFFKRKGEGLMTSEEEHNAILGNIRLDGINISLEDEPDKDVRVEKIDLDPKISELIEMCKFHIQYMMSQANIPQGLMFGEETNNRATMVAAMKGFINGPIKKYRKWFLDNLTMQYYARLGATLAKQDDAIKQILEDFELVAEVDEFVLEDWKDLIQPQMMLEQLNPFTDEARAKNLHIPGYEGMIDPSAEPPPMPGKNAMSVKSEDGQEFEVSDK